MTILKYALLRSMRDRSALFALWVVPVILAMIRPLWQGSYIIGFYLYGMLLLYTSYIVALSMMKDRVSGVTVRVYAAPVTTFQYLFQTLVAYALLLIVQILLMVGMGTMLHRWSLTLVMGLVLCYTVFAGTSLALVIAWHSLFRRKDTSDAVFSVVASFIALLGGIFIPTSYMPLFLQRIGMFMPTYWMSSAVWTLQAEGFAWNYWQSLLVLMMFSLIFLLMGSRRRFE